MSIQNLVPVFEPSDYEPPPITSRSGLPPYLAVLVNLFANYLITTVALLIQSWNDLIECTAAPISF